MANFHDLRGLVNLLEERGKLFRFRGAINKDTELVPLFRIQMRGLSESERKVFLFDNVVGAKGKKYDMSVLVGVYAASEDVLAIGMRCQGYIEMLEKWHHCLTNPIAPVLVDSGPVQEVVHVGDEIKQLGLDEFPVPVEDPGFSGMIRTGVPMITKDAETGIRNVGAYNGFFRARDRLIAGIGPSKHAMAHHWEAARQRKEGLPIAIVIGCVPEVMLVASAPIPYGADELAVAGAVAGSPIELVRCRTIPLEVPAHAEAVIEGIVSTEIMEPLLPFGEYPGYFRVDLNIRPIIQVTAVTHRRNAMFTPLLVGFPPSDDNLISGFCESAQMYHYLKYERRLPVEEIHLPQSGGGSNFCLIRVRAGASQETVSQILGAAEKCTHSKYVVAVDADVDLRAPELLIWALSFSTQPKEDFTIVPGHTAGLDPSAAPTGSGRSRMSSTEGRKLSRVLVNATRKWPYPPVGLPRKEYMERALRLWQEQRDLPPPRLKEPYYGYSLGYWSQELQEYADLIAHGEYLKVGEKMAKLQTRVTDEI